MTSSQFDPGGGRRHKTLGVVSGKSSDIKKNLANEKVAKCCIILQFFGK